MRRREFAFRSITGLSIGFAGVTAAWSQPTDDGTPLVAAPKILDALVNKDIVLDRPGHAQGSIPRGIPKIDLQVQFAFDSADLRASGKRQLDELAVALSDQKLLAWGFLLAGHTDRTGGYGYNLRLSLARANSVKVYLAQAHGVAEHRLQTIGYGGSHPLDLDRPAAALNRRVEVRRTALLLPESARSSYGGRLVPTPR